MAAGRKFCLNLRMNYRSHIRAVRRGAIHVHSPSISNLSTDLLLSSAAGRLAESAGRDRGLAMPHYKCINHRFMHVNSHLPPLTPWRSPRWWTFMNIINYDVTLIAANGKQLTTIACNYEIPLCTHLWCLAFSCMHVGKCLSSIWRFFISN